MSVQASKVKRLCWRCTGEEYLRDEIRSGGKLAKCSYCQRRAKSYSIGDMADRIDEVFEEHFQRTSNEPNSWQITLLSDRESEYDWERDGEPVTDAIRNSADIPDAAAEDIQAVLEDKYYDFEQDKIGEENDFASDSYYEERGPNDGHWQEEWREFEHSLKTQARFFSGFAGELLKSVFKGIDAMTARDGRSLIIEVGPGTALASVYRARTFQSDDRLKEALARPDLYLGSPPPILAKAGRMNARGISVFYGADSAEVAVAEVRPPVGSQVAVARFNILRPLQLLDLTALSSVAEGGSLFDPELGNRINRAMFLRSLSQRIIRPVMPDDEEFEYLPTQVIADFLAFENDPPLDGILFPSAQIAGAGHNIVFFHRSARVDTSKIPSDAEIDVRLGANYEEGWERDYHVTQWVRPTNEASPDSSSTDVPLAFSAEADFRDMALEVDMNSIRIHVVDRVHYDTDDYDVTRHEMSTDIRDHWDRMLGGGGANNIARNPDHEIPL